MPQSDPHAAATGDSGLDLIELRIFESRAAAICETMGAVLRRSAFSCIRLVNQ